MTEDFENFEFQKFDKIPRLRRNLTITEKLDGTNGQILVVNRELVQDWQLPLWPFIEAGNHFMLVGSRKRWLKLTKTGDNYGFCKWAAENREELCTLGEGRHYGEWFGQGIQRGYDMDKKVFALFNTGRWNEMNPAPACCSVVPVLMTGEFNNDIIQIALDDLAINGSTAAPGYKNTGPGTGPEGIVIFMAQARRLFKVTLENDAQPKSLPKPKKASTIMKTSKEWMKDYPLADIYDPDGWDRENYDFSFNVERITLAEFKYRFNRSTVQGIVTPAGEGDGGMIACQPTTDLKVEDV